MIYTWVVGSAKKNGQLVKELCTSDGTGRPFTRLCALGLSIKHNGRARPQKGQATMTHPFPTLHLYMSGVMQHNLLTFYENLEPAQEASNMFIIYFIGSLSAYINDYDDTIRVSVCFKHIQLRRLYSYLT